MATPESWRSWRSPVPNDEDRAPVSGFRQLSDEVLIALGCMLFAGGHGSEELLGRLADLLDQRTRPSVWSARLWNLVHEERLQPGRTSLEQFARWHPRRGEEGAWIQGYVLLGGDELRAYVAIADLIDAGAAA